MTPVLHVGRDEARISRARVLLAMRWPLGEIPPGAHFALRDNFGVWRHLRDGTSHQHPGTDIEAPRGTTIFASRAGRVIDSSASGRQNRTMGHFVKWQDRAEPSITHYAMHMAHAPTNHPPGSNIGEGETLGEIGTTGRSDGPHLHYGMELNGRMVDAYPSLLLALQRAQSVQGFALVGQTPADESTAWWTARNADVTRLLALSNAFVWPTVVLDNAPDPSETREMLRTIRQTYQATMRTWTLAYRAARDHGDREGARAIVEAMALTVQTMTERTRGLVRLFSRTLVENLAHGIDASAQAAADVLAHLGETAADVATGAGIGLGLAAIVALMIMRGSR